MIKFITALSLLSLMTIASTTLAEELHYNLVNLYGSAQSQIDNDVLIVTLLSTADADSAQKAAAIVNHQMKWAHEIIKDMTEIKKQTLNYQTRPRYQNKVIVGWSASQQLQLESQDIDTLSQTIGTLQEKLQVSSMQFGISHKRKQEHTDTLITQALAAFQEKAKLVTANIGAQDFRFVTLSINENAPPAPRHRGIAMEAMATADVPQVEAGESKLSVRVDGSIQLIF